MAALTANLERQGLKREDFEIVDDNMSPTVKPSKIHTAAPTVRDPVFNSSAMRAEGGIDRVIEGTCLTVRADLGATVKLWLQDSG